VSGGAWEYRVEWSDVGEGENAGYDAAEDWMDLLNTLGHDGWELVMEHRVIGDSASDGATLWIRYVGTFKRPRAA
jgi:hypothetical protein